MALSHRLQVTAEIRLLDWLAWAVDHMAWAQVCKLKPFSMCCS